MNYNYEWNLFGQHVIGLKDYEMEYLKHLKQKRNRGLHWKQSAMLES